MDDDGLSIEAGLVGDGAAGVLGCARQTEGLGEVERGVQADLADLVRVNLFGGNKPSAMGLLTRLKFEQWECFLRL